MGLAAFAFGLGGAAANLAGLLHMAGHSVVKSAIFFGIGHAARIKGSQKIADIGGLVGTHPALGWGLAIAIAAIAGMPPFAVFASEFLLVTQTAAQAAWLLLPLGLGLFVAVAAKIVTLQRLCLGDPTPDGPAPPGPGAALTALVPLWLHLALALLIGIALPAPLAAMLQEAARMLG
jgi:hydrogenase-4 component F